MLDVWDMPDGEFILVEVYTFGNPMVWEGKTLLNAIGSLVRRHQFAPIKHISWKDMPETDITNMIDLIKVFIEFFKFYFHSFIVIFYYFTKGLTIWLFNK